LVDDFYKHMKKEQELLDISYKESVRQKRERKKKEKEKEEKYVWQWYWGFDWLGNKVKNIYFGPKLDWMKLFTRRKKKKK
jgi:hypothetical protein